MNKFIINDYSLCYLCISQNASANILNCSSLEQIKSHSYTGEIFTKYFIFLLFFYRYDAKVKRIQDRISQYQDLTWFDLDKWEVPRNQVILNRKLGEGAFGTVYGGEALLDDVWVAVAVKTLKIGSTSEEKASPGRITWFHI